MSDALHRLIPVASDHKVTELSRIRLFEHVPRRQLSFIAANLDEVEEAAGETLIRENHHNDAFWILLDGEVDLIIGGEHHRTVGSGGFFGATSMLDGKPAVATVVTKSPVRAFVASQAQFRALEGNETVALRLMSAALERMREDLEIQRHHRGSEADAAPTG